MPELNVCPDCGSAIPAGSAPGLCAGCLLLLAEGAEPAETVRSEVLAQDRLAGAALESFGDYDLLEKIGHGGMGIVWKARQLSLNRFVALKVIKPGMDSGQVLTRFDAERQALALMDHPNIARVIDAGTTPAGWPFFVMELVEGVPIVRFCDERRLTIRERLELFIQVCQAIQHAHQKGVIHRDIKPGNVLVTEQEGRPIPKVIDFGIAKAIGPRLTTETIATEMGELLGTLEYMSPEQASLNSFDIDTRSDIYSLGILLYELLTGTTPLDRKTLQQVAFDELLRRIRQEEPARPSTRITQGGVTLDSTAARRRVSPAHLARLLQGDVDWIVIRALEKDRNRRYATASALAQDVLRHLQDEPVVAGPPSTRYRLKKFATRHRTAVAAVAGLMLVLISATTVSLIFAARANRERARAERASGSATESAQEAKEVLEFFANRVLAAARPKGQGPGLGRDVSVRSALDAAEPRIGSSFKNRPLVEARVRDVLGRTYYDLGNRSNAVIQHSRALELRTTYQGRTHEDTLITMEALAADYAGVGDLAKSLSLAEEAYRGLRATLGATNRSTLRAALTLAVGYRRANRLEDALHLLQQMVPHCQVHLGTNDPNTLSAMNSLGRTYHEAGRLAEAIPVLEKTLALRRKALVPEHPDIATSINNLALAYQGMGNHAEALSLLEETVRLSETNSGPDHLDTLISMSNLAGAYVHANRLDEALKLYEQTVERMQKQFSPDHPNLLRTLNNLSTVYTRQGRFDDALPLIQKTHERQKAKLGPDHRETLESMLNVAATLRAAGRLQEALPLLEEAVRLSRGRHGAQDKGTVLAMNNLATVYCELDRDADALPILKEAVEMMRQQGPADSIVLLSALDKLARIHANAGRFGEAELLWRDLLAAHRKKLPEASIELADTLTSLGECLLRQAKLAEAETLLREALAIRGKNSPDESAFHTQLFLGATLSGLKRHAEAESMLIQSYEGLKLREAGIPSKSQLVDLKFAIEQLTLLYDDWKKADQAVAWRKKLAELPAAPSATAR